MTITPEKELLLYTLKFCTVLIQIQGYYTRPLGRRALVGSVSAQGVACHLPG